MESTNRNYQEALDFLFGRIDYERAPAMPYQEATLKQARMVRLLELLGDPHQSLRIIHVAGTKGKGSTCTMLHSMLRAAGYRVGLYTSPHLNRVEERFVVDGTICPEDEFVRIVAQLRPLVEQVDREADSNGLTYFEITTAIAFQYFASRKVDYAVIEVGMGGRLDSTNVCQPIASVITSISFDHMKQLGNTLPQIAREKAGIIKPGIPVISGVRDEGARTVIRRIAAELDCPLIEVGTDFEAEVISSETLRPGRFHYRPIRHGTLCELDNIEVGLFGIHQIENAAVAVAVCQTVGQAGSTIPAAAIRAGLSDIQCRARIEIVNREPTVILDSAHNVASIQALVDAVRSPNRYSCRWLLLAATQGKDLDGMLRLLIGEFDRIVFTRYLNNPRARQPAGLLRVASQLARERCLDVSLTTRDTPAAAWDFVREAVSKRDLVCVTGSFFIAGEIRELLGQTDLSLFEKGQSEFHES